MKKVIAVLLGIMLLAGCEMPALEKEISFYDMVEMLGMKTSEIVEKEENGDDVRVIYGQNKHDIVMYDNFDRVVTEDYVMYENGEVLLTISEVQELNVKKLLLCAEISRGLREMWGEKIEIDFYEKDMVKFTDNTGESGTVTVGVWFKEESRRENIIFEFKDGKFTDGRVE